MTDRMPNLSMHIECFLSNHATYSQTLVPVFCTLQKFILAFKMFGAFLLCICKSQLLSVAVFVCCMCTI